MATPIRLFGLLLLLAPLVSAPAHAARSCSSEHRYFGNYPREKEPGWHDEAQGVTHDDRHWFFSQNPDRVFTDPEVCRSPHACSRLEPKLWKLDVSVPLASKVRCGDPGVVCSEPFSAEREMWLQGYDHFGDISHYQGFVLVSLDGAVGDEPLPARLLVYDAEELDLLGYAGLPQVGGAGFVAVDPHGIVYVPRSDKERLYRYRIDWDALRRREAYVSYEEQHGIPMPSDGVRIVEELPTMRFVDENGARLVIEHLQGADFTPDGRFLYISSGYLSDYGVGGIHVFEVSDTELGGDCVPESRGCTARRIERSENPNVWVPSPNPFQPGRVRITVEPETEFVYEYDSHSFTYEEPEGITYWDLFVTIDGETERTQVHTILLDNDGPFGEDDDVFLKHWSAELSCKGEVFVWLEAEDGALVSPMQIGSHPSASRGRYVVVPAGSGSGGSARYTFSVPQDGEYVIWAHEAAPSEQADSFWVRIDDGRFEYWNPARGSGANDWRWDAVRPTGASEPRVYALTKGTHTLEIRQAEAGTKLDRLLVTDDLDFVPFSAFVEAESGALSAPMRIEPRWGVGFGVSGGRYVTVPNGSGTGGRASYVFAAPIPAIYHVWGRVGAPHGGDDSFFVSIDNAPELLWDTRRSSGWVWDRVSDRGAGDASFRLLDRLHVLEIRQREDGTKLDRLFISNDPGFVPQVPHCYYGDCVYEPPSPTPPPPVSTYTAPVYGTSWLLR